MRLFLIYRYTYLPHLHGAFERTDERGRGDSWRGRLARGPRAELLVLHDVRCHATKVASWPSGIPRTSCYALQRIRFKAIQLFFCKRRSLTLLYNTTVSEQRKLPRVPIYLYSQFAAANSQTRQTWDAIKKCACARRWNDTLYDVHNNNNYTCVQKDDQ